MVKGLTAGRSLVVHAAPARAAGAGDPLTRPAVAVDAMGGDHAPDQVVAGAVAAVREHQVRVVLTGQPTILRHLLAEQGADRDIPIVPADDVLSMEEGALASSRRPRSSPAVGCQPITRGQAGALVSARSTAAAVA